MSVTVAEVQARWGYSEILDGTFAACYDNGPHTPAIRQKRKNGTPFQGLTDDEKYCLAFQAANIRVNLMPYLTGIEQFTIVELDRTQLGKLWVPGNVWKDSLGKAYPFDHYIQTSTNEAGDARTITIDPKNYLRPTDPITIGRSFQYPILIDGYHRSAVFWKFGPPADTIPAFVPRGLLI